MPVHFPSESGASVETPYGRSNGRTPDSVRLGFFSATRKPGVSEASQTSPRRFNSAFVLAWVANFDSEVPALNRRELGAIPRQPTNFQKLIVNS